MTAQRQSPRHLLAAIGAMALLIGGAVVANQGGFRFVSPEGLAASAYLWLDALPTLAAVWLGAAGLGWPLRRWLAPNVRCRAAVQLAAGLAALLMGDWLLAWAGLLNTTTAWLLCGVRAALLSWQLSSPKRRELLQPEHWANPPWPLLLGLPLLGLFAVAATVPPGYAWSVEAFGYDVTSYHLQIPREWLESGHMQGLHHNVYSYLPNLVEAGYMQIGAMRGSMYAGIYTTQLFHASTAVLAAIGVACLVAPAAGSAAAVLASVVLMAVPWVLITGSLSYDECVVLALAAGAFHVAFDPAGKTWRGAALVGFLLGAATLAKLTAGPMFVVPLVLLIAARLTAMGAERATLSRKRFLALAGATAVAGALTISPYLIRNMIWTGNPVFPMEAKRLGHGHWTAEQVQRWNNSLRTSGDTGLGTLLARHWLFNTGYGAVGGWTRDVRKSTEVARFPREGGFPVLWTCVALASILALRSTMTRRMAVAMLIVLAMQVLFWLTGTHHQSRFLVYTVLPAAALIGLGFSRLADVPVTRRPWTRVAAAVLIVAPLEIISFTVFFTQTRPSGGGGGDGGNDGEHQQPWQIVDILPRPNDFNGLINIHPLNRLGPDTRTLLVADAGSLLYILRPFTYHSAFDQDQLGDLITMEEKRLGGPTTLTQRLTAAGYTHIWVSWSELRRLGSSYGYDPRITPQVVRDAAIQGRWHVLVNEPGVVTLFELPR